MKVLLLNGSNQNDGFSDSICSMLDKELRSKEHAVEQINLWEKEIGSCLGCFGCWIKTPGICVIPDEGLDIAKAVVQSDLVINVSPITFGGYSYELKKTLERLIPIISPFFMKINGEVHHKPRYASYPKSITIGIMSKENKEMADIFKILVERNAINMHNPFYKSKVITHSMSKEETRSEMFKMLGEVGI